MGRLFCIIQGVRTKEHLNKTNPVEIINGQRLLGAYIYVIRINIDITLYWFITLYFPSLQEIRTYHSMSVGVTGFHTTRVYRMYNLKPYWHANRFCICFLNLWYASLLPQYKSILYRINKCKNL